MTIPFESAGLFSLLSALSALSFELLVTPLVDVEDGPAALLVSSAFDAFLTRLENVDSTFFFFTGDWSADDSGGLLFFRFGSCAARNESEMREQNLVFAVRQSAENWYIPCLL